ncbi:hypothetical protein ABOM_007800 [Aspergillus bombycis]|uniref:NmrA-like domain-containing protein n=1 Tax=Aspergillus bombycis TaxID=109264 RepID=A0A1F7ZX82_9EURO|nr:hypothetical protein ABOM_007800 [Aspergillus bombycis]OGM44050.1 hypothetical protein ABOM_007800 [Aspergillus bombycis]
MGPNLSEFSVTFHSHPPTEEPFTVPNYIATMQITIAPASPQTCRAAIQALLCDSSAPLVIGIYRDLNKVPAEFRSHRNFKAIRGDLKDRDTLDFTGSDAVLTLTPPCLDGSDFVAQAKAISSNVRDAVVKAKSVKRLVYISSMGAQFASGVGEVQANHESERILEYAAPEVVLVRNGFFMENWRDALATLTADPPFFYSTVTPIDYKMPMVSANDIGKACARHLLQAGSALKASPHIFKLHGPVEYSTSDVQRAFEEVTGKKVEVRLVERDELKAYFSKFLPLNLVDKFVEMTWSFLPDGILEQDMNDFTGIERGHDTLVDAFKKMLSM